MLETYAVIEQGFLSCIRPHKDLCLSQRTILIAGPRHAAGLHDITSFRTSIIMFYQFLAFTLCLALSNSRAFPLSSPLQNRADVNCSDTKAPFDASCWKTLGVEDYLKKWNQSTPICSSSNYVASSNSSSDCCTPDELWSVCFMRLRYGQAGHDCSKINPQSCSWNYFNGTSLGNDAATKNYVLRAIYSRTPLIAIQSLDDTRRVLG